MGPKGYETLREALDSAGLESQDRSSNSSDIIPNMNDPIDAVPFIEIAYSGYNSPRQVLNALRDYVHLDLKGQSGPAPAQESRMGNPLLYPMDIDSKNHVITFFDINYPHSQ